MINAKMREYDYYLIGNDNDYGQATVIKDEHGNFLKQGTIKLSISTVTQAVADNIRYSDTTYIGLTKSKVVNDNFIIHYDNEYLKVQYVNPEGRYTQVFMGAYQ